VGIEKLSTEKKELEMESEREKENDGRQEKQNRMK